MKPILAIAIPLSLFTFKSFAQSHLFSKYRVSMYHGRKANVIIKGNPLAEMYKTIIKETYYATDNMKKWHGSTGLNFAGHYCFAWWGCGSPCQNSAVIDLKTGVVYQGVTSSVGYAFKRDSKLLIVNPGGTIDSCAFCGSEYWIWNERSKAFKRIN